MVIDFHTHIFPDKIAERTVSTLSKNGGIPAHSDGTKEGLLLKMAEAGVDISINLPVITRQEQLDSVNAFARNLNEKSYTGPRIISFAGIHPDNPSPEEAILRIKEQGFLGIKIHPDYQGAFIDDARYTRILSAAKAAGLITVTHAGVDGAYLGQPVKCTPVRVLRLLDKIGGYERFVLAHLGANEMVSEVLECLVGEDVYFDTAYSLRSTGKHRFMKLLEAHGEDKILFATDSPWQSPKRELEFIRGLSLNPDTEEKILSGNAIKLLNLD